MSLSISLTDTYSLPGVARSESFEWQSIFRTSTIKIAAECLTLLSLSIGLFSLFLGLAVI